MFKNRLDAADQLARALEVYRGQHPLVLGIPRGGVVLAHRIAQVLEGDLDVVMVRKIGAPGYAEYAIGCVTEDGQVFLNPAGPDVDQAYVESVVHDEMKTMRRRRLQYGKGQPSVPIKDRTVIVVDDGVATGATMLGALHGLRSRQPKRIVLAVPVAPPDTAMTLCAEVDDCVILEKPPYFQGVGQFYEDFGETTDDTVIRLLADAHREG
ncbi:MAG: phosphoribosyltransferase [Candidatus Margulisiibacteriota bacterium]